MSMAFVSGRQRQEPTQQTVQSVGGKLVLLFAFQTFKNSVEQLLASFLADGR